MFSGGSIIIDLTMVTCSASMLYYFYEHDQSHFINVLGYLLACILSYVLTDKMIKPFSRKTEAAGLFGYDLNKKGTPAGEIKIPESLGIVPASVYIIFTLLGL